MADADKRCASCLDNSGRASDGNTSICFYKHTIDGKAYGFIKACLHKIPPEGTDALADARK